MKMTLAGKWKTAIFHTMKIIIYNKTLILRNEINLFIFNKVSSMKFVLISILILTSPKFLNYMIFVCSPAHRGGWNRFKGIHVAVSDTWQGVRVPVEGRWRADESEW